MFHIVMYSTLQSYQSPWSFPDGLPCMFSTLCLCSLVHPDWNGLSPSFHSGNSGLLWPSSCGWTPLADWISLLDQVLIILKSLWCLDSAWHRRGAQKIQQWAKRGLQFVSMQDTEFIIISLFINDYNIYVYCNYKPTFAQPCTWQIQSTLLCYEFGVMIQALGRW